MNIDNLTIGELKSINQLVGKTTSSPYEIGKNYAIRTVTMIDVGRLVDVTDQELVLEDASWIPDTGRFHEFLQTGKANEVEPFPDGKVIVGRGAIIDGCIWPFDLPRQTK